MNKTYGLPNKKLKLKTQTNNNIKLYVVNLFKIT